MTQAYNRRVSELTAATSATEGDTLYLVKDGASRKISVRDLIDSAVLSTSAGVAAAILDAARRRGELLLDDYGVLPVGHVDYNEAACWANFVELAEMAATEDKTILIGAGSYSLRQMPTNVATWVALAGMRGVDRSRSKLSFQAASSGDLWPMPLLAADSYRNPSVFSGFEIDFKKADQAAGVRGIVVNTPTPGAGLAAYCVSPVFESVELMWSKGDALTFEIGRNLVMLDNVRAYGGDSDGIVIDGSMDCKISRSNIGSFTSGYGLHIKRGSGIYGELSHFFGCKTNLFVTHNTTDFDFIRCDFDRATEYACLLRGVSDGNAATGSFYGCTFTLSSSSSSGTYPEVKVEGARRLSFTACKTPHYGGAHTSVSSRFIEFVSYGTDPDASPNDPVPAIIDGMLYDPALAATLWPSGFTNNWAMVRQSGWSPLFGVTFPSASQVGVTVNGVMGVVYNQTYWTSGVPAYFNNSSITIQNTSAGADEKKSRIARSNHNGRELIGLAFLNDAESASTLGFGVKRVGYAFSTLYSGLLPTSSAGLASGDYWCDAGAGNVVKQVP